MGAVTGDDWQVMIVQEHGGQRFANVYVAKHEFGFSPGDVADTAEDAWTVTNSFAEFQVQDIGYVETRVAKVDGSVATVVRSWQNTESNGRSVGDPVDPGSCMGYTLRSGLAGKSRRGRIYIGGVDRQYLNSFSTAWDLTTTGGLLLADAANVWVGQLASNNVVLEVFSRTLIEVFTITETLARSSILSQNQRARRYGTV